MSLKRRRKGIRYPGSKTHGRGRKNRTRGSGNRGGVGMSGSGKRGDQKKTLVIHQYGNAYFGKDQRGHGSREKKKTPSMSLRSISERLQTFLKKGSAKENKGMYEVSLPKYKIIGDDAFGLKMTIHAYTASEGAVQAVRKAGGSIIVKDTSAAA